MVSLLETHKSILIFYEWSEHERQNSKDYAKVIVNGFQKHYEMDGFAYLDGFIGRLYVCF